MYVDITNTVLSKPVLYLCKPNRDIICNLSDAYAIKHNIKLGQISELNFSIPYSVEINHEMVSTPYIDLIKNRYLIKYVFDNYTEWFVIHIPESNADDEILKNVTCYSLAYELTDKIVRVYNEVAKNATEVLIDVLDTTIWSVGHVDASFDLMYRSFDVTSCKVLDLLFQIATTFGGIIKWDTENRTVNLYTYETIGINRGLVFDYGKYLQSINSTIDPETFCTRLHLMGKDGVTINSVNPTGTTYIDNFTYFLDGFTRDENKIPLTHSSYMSDGLCNALLDYQILIDSKANDFSTLLSQLNLLQKDLLAKSSELYDLNEELIVIQDSLDMAQSTGTSTITLIIKKTEKEAEIATKQSEIDALNASANSVLSLIVELNNEIKTENNFTAKQLTDLNQFIIEAELSNEYISDPIQLLNWGLKQLEKLIEPQIIIDISVVNFLQCLDPQCFEDKDKLYLGGGDIVTIKYDKFNIDIEATISEISLDYDNDTIDLVISNIKDIKKDMDRFLEIINKAMSTSTDVDMNKYKWNEIESTANAVGVIFNNIIDAVTLNIKGSVNESIKFGRQGIIVVDPTDPLNLVRINHSNIALSTSGGQKFENAITPFGLVGEKIIGKILLGQRLTIDASTEEGLKFFEVNETGVTINGLYLNIIGGIPASQIEGGDWLVQDVLYGGVKIGSAGFVATTANVGGKYTQILASSDPEINGFKIRKTLDDGTTFTDKFYVNGDGDLVVSANMVGGTITIGSGSNIFKADQLGIYLGNSNYAFAPFKVSPSGYLTAYNADIRGEIDCTDLLINGESILSIAQTMISDSTFKGKIEGLGIVANQITDPENTNNKIFFGDIEEGSGKGVEVKVTDGTHYYSMDTYNGAFRLNYDAKTFLTLITIPITDKCIAYAQGEWHFEDAIVQSDSYFESGNADWNSSGMDFMFTNSYSEHPTYIVHPPCNTNVITSGGKITGIHIVPIGGASGDKYNVIAFCKGKV